MNYIINNELFYFGPLSFHKYVSVSQCQPAAQRCLFRRGAFGAVADLCNFCFARSVFAALLADIFCDRVCATPKNSASLAWYVSQPN